MNLITESIENVTYFKNAASIQTILRSSFFCSGDNFLFEPPNANECQQNLKRCIIDTVIELNIPGRTTFKLEHLVCDVNGTLALDGELIDGVSRLLGRLKDRLSIHLVSADTLGRLDDTARHLGVKAIRLTSAGDEAGQKLAVIRQLGAEHVIAVGQGFNDQLMLKEAAIGIAVLSREGTAVQSILQADILAPDIIAALEMLEKPIRIVATLRK